MGAMTHALRDHVRRARDAEARRRIRRMDIEGRTSRRGNPDVRLIEQELGLWASSGTLGWPREETTA